MIPIPPPLRKWWWVWQVGDDRPHVIGTSMPCPFETPYLPPEPPRRDDPDFGDEPSPPYPDGWAGDQRGGIIQLEPGGELDWVLEVDVHGARRKDRELAKARRKRRKPKPKPQASGQLELDPVAR